MSQVEYLGRWVDRGSFRAFVYNQQDQLLAKSYNEFSELLASGLWFASRELAMAAIHPVKGQPKSLLQEIADAKVSNSLPLDSSSNEEKQKSIKDKAKEKAKNELKAADNLDK